MEKTVRCLSGQPHVDYERIDPGASHPDGVYGHAGEEFEPDTDDSF
jgi:hypothetical protein